MKNRNLLKCLFFAAIVLTLGIAGAAESSKTTQNKSESRGYRKIEKSEVIWIDVDEDDLESEGRGSYEIKELRKKVSRLEKATRQLQDRIVLLEEKLEELSKDKEPESYTCILESSFNKVYEATGKTEKEARMQVYLKCRQAEKLGSACVQKRIKCAI